MTSVVDLDERGDRVMMAIDPSRVRRSLELDVQPLGDGAYIVSGGAEPHHVTTSEKPWRCDCMDAAYRRDVRCKHVLSAYNDFTHPCATRCGLRWVRHDYRRGSHPGAGPGRPRGRDVTIIRIESRKARYRFCTAARCVCGRCGTQGEGQPLPVASERPPGGHDATK